MRSNEVVISKGASTDISKLAAGANRVDVALEALKGESLSPQQIAALQYQINILKVEVKQLLLVVTVRIVGGVKDWVTPLEGASV
jgi:hypothetical protein